MNAEHVKKMLIKGPMKILIMNASPDYTDELEDLPAGSDAIVWEPHRGPLPVVEGEFDFVRLFARSRAELTELAETAIRAVKRDGLLWIAYPDNGCEARGNAGKPHCQSGGNACER